MITPDPDPGASGGFSRGPSFCREGGWIEPVLGEIFTTAGLAWSAISTKTFWSSSISLMPDASSFARVGDGARKESKRTAQATKRKTEASDFFLSLIIYKLLS